MSYSKFKKNIGEFVNIFPNSKKEIVILKEVDNKNINLVLSSEVFVSSLKPILEKMLNSEVDDKKVVLIPNAGVGAEKATMSYQYLEEFTTINNMYLKQLDLTRWPKKVILEALESCDVLAFSGGLVSRLTETIDEIGIREEIVKMILKGKPTIGFSAGSMIMSKTTKFAENYMGESDSAAANIKPLGVVDFEVYPHFEDTMRTSVGELAQGIKEAYAIKSDEALIIFNGKLLKIGEEINLGMK